MPSLSKIVKTYYDTGDVDVSISIPDAGQKWLFNNILDVCDELNKFDIKCGDILNADNWGIKNNKLVFFDVGNAQDKTFSGDVPLIEAVIPRPIQRIFAALGVSGEYLGSGTNGHAYKLSDGRVLKQTTDRSEAVNSKKLIGQNVEHLANVYNVYKLKENENIYIIILEYIPQSPSLDKLLTNLESYFKNSY